MRSMEDPANVDIHSWEEESIISSVNTTLYEWKLKQRDREAKWLHHVTQQIQNQGQSRRPKLSCAGEPVR